MFIPQIIIMFFGFIGVDTSTCVETTQRSIYGFEVAGYYCQALQAQPATQLVPIRSRQR